MELDHQGSRALYQQLADVLRGQIASGEIPPGRPVPSKKTLCQLYEVSAGTVEHALRLLKDEGLLMTAPGKGLYVIAENERPQG